MRSSVLKKQAWCLKTTLTVRSSLAKQLSNPQEPLLRTGFKIQPQHFPLLPHAQDSDNQRLLDEPCHEAPEVEVSAETEQEAAKKKRPSKQPWANQSFVVSISHIWNFEGWYLIQN